MDGVGRVEDVFDAGYVEINSSSEFSEEMTKMFSLSVWIF